jgi:dipeptidyl aminopeptidase/acylaminoacyl peptidase
MRYRLWKTILLVSFVPSIVAAQVTRADYERAAGLRRKYDGLAVNIVDRANWIGKTDRFWYRRSVKGGYEFMVADAETLTKKPAFDHERLAASLSTATGKKYSAITLPFMNFTFVDNEERIEFMADASRWKCTLSDYRCEKLAPIGPSFDRPDNPEEEPPSEYANDVVDGMVDLSVQAQQGTQGQAQFGPGRSQDQEPRAKTSPDGKWEAFIQNYNLFIRPKGQTESVDLSFDGSEGDYYTLSSINWSSDSAHLAAYRVRQGYKRQVHYVESSPSDQLQPKYSSRDYAKPGDALDIAQPMLFDLATRKQIVIDNALFPNPYSLSNPVWRKDGRAFTFEYNQRGHQVYRVIEVEAVTGKPRALVSEQSATFIDYRPLNGNPRDTGKKYRYELNDGREFIWASERDGWNHLYLYDGITGKLKNQITKGNWVVRAVQKVDEAKRQILFQASGMYPGKDPYFVHYYRINFDGSGLTALTETDANHMVDLSDDLKYYIDTWSRVDKPTVCEIRRTVDRKILMEVESGEITALLAAGWRPPEVFTATGRDGKTDIWGVIYRPANFNATKKYPVIESIYAGPQGSFVPKTFSAVVQPLTELGFIVVQIDGMGTNNRSRAFHDVAFKDLADAGFADRILWHKALAAKYPWYDISRVGIFGTSAGGQNAMGALLFHPEFYQVAVSNSGCHDNRMDKIWWNEQWMSWPLGPQYAASSNVDNAARLQGKLLLVMGEMDTNVDPSSTLQVVNALIKANKKFDLLYVPGGGHGAGGAYGQRLLEDFFVHNLLGAEPPDWNQSAPAKDSSGN